MAFGPSPEASWHALRDRLDLDRLDEGSFAAIPVVRRVLRDDLADDPLLPRLTGIYRHTWARSQLVLQHLPSLLDAVHAAGVGTLLVGAAPRVLAPGGDPGLRRVDRLELLTAPGDLARAEAAVLSAGWRPPERGTGRSRSLAVLDGPCPLLLRARVLPEFPPAGGESDFDYLAAAASTVRINGREAGAPGCSDDLVLALLDGARPTPAPTIVWLLDALTVLVDALDEIDWLRVLDHARARGGLLRLRDGLCYLTRSVGAPVPSTLLAELEAAATPRGERLAHRARARLWPVIGPFPEPLARYLRSVGREGLLDVLRETYGTESRVGAAHAALVRAAVRLREARDGY